MSIEYPGAEPDAQPERPAPSLGVVATVGAAALGVVVAVAVAVAAEGDQAAGTGLAWVAIVGTALTFALGIGAVVLRRGRRWGIAAVILSVLANPWILTRALSFLETLTAP
jgi:hypothetical protein